MLLDLYLDIHHMLMEVLDVHYVLRICVHQIVVKYNFYHPLFYTTGLLLLRPYLQTSCVDYLLEYVDMYRVEQMMPFFVYTYCYVYTKTVNFLRRCLLI